LSKIKLNIDLKPDFELVGISTPLLAHKVSFFLNSSLKFRLNRIDDLEVIDAKNKSSHFFKRFEYHDDQFRKTYYLISNKDQGKFCLPDYPMLDYIILVKGNYEEEEKSKLVKDIRLISDITYVIDIPLYKLNGSENLMFERKDGKDTF